jgi:hypothetical protein
MIRHLTSYWCILTLDFILMSSDTWLHIDVFWWIPVLLICISLHFCYILYIFVLYTMYFCYILEKIQIENIPVEHYFNCQWRTLSVAHLDWVRRRYYAWRTPHRCAMDRTLNRGACGCAPLVINTSGLICVAHHWCAMEAQIGAPQIRVFLVVRGSQQSSREVKPKFIDSTQGEPKNIYKP